MFVPQYFEIREQCLEEWGDAADWCSVKVYHPQGLFGETSCGCRVIIPPDCDNGVNKTLPGEVFDTLGSDVTVAMSGGYCNLVGPIPEEIGNMRNLKILTVFINHLNGTIPASIGELVKLEYLNFGVNYLSGEIPMSMANMRSLEMLALDNNQFNGEILEQILELQKLVEIWLLDNNFSGNMTMNLLGKFSLSTI